MEFFNLGLGVVLNLINTVLDQAYDGALYFGIAGGVLGLIIVLLGFRFKLFNRRRKAFKVVKLIYPLWFPLGMAIIGSGLGAVDYAGTAFKGLVPTEITPLTKISFTGFQFMVKRNWDNIERQQIPYDYLVEKFTSGIAYEPYLEDDWMEDMKVNIANEISPKATRWGIESVVNAALNEAGDGAAEMTAEEWDRKALMLVKDTDITEYPKDFWKQVDDSTCSEIDAHMGGMNMRLMGALFVLLVLPAIEILLNLRHR